MTKYGVDLSSNNSTVDFKILHEREAKDFCILRSTLKSGHIDPMCERYTKDALTNNMEVSYYKFMYALDYDSAYMEMAKAIDAVRKFNPHPFTMWIDIESWGNHKHTTEEAGDIIWGAKDACDDLKVQCGLYCNLDYLLRVIPKYFREILGVWLARYNTSMTAGHEKELAKWNILLWQYSSKGVLKSTKSKVDLDKEV